MKLKGMLPLPMYAAYPTFLYLKVIASCYWSSEHPSLDVHPLPHVDLDGAVGDCAVSAPELFAASNAKVDIATVDAVDITPALAGKKIRQQSLKICNLEL